MSACKGSYRKSFAHLGCMMMAWEANLDRSLQLERYPT